MTQTSPQDLSANRSKQLLAIAWHDGHRWQYPFRYLRQKCSCAQCVHEITGELLLDPDSVPLDISIRDMKLVGNYAVRIHWSDEHATGLYTWQRLRELCCCPECNS